MKFIDPHIHLFNLALGQYHWLKPENPPFWPDKHIIYKNFTEVDLTTSPELSHAGFVHIEAGFNNNEPWQEIHWLESQCTHTFKSVACIDITLSPQAFNEHLQKLLTYKSVVGCRHILDDDANDILQNKNTAINLEQLAKKNLSFDLQMPLTNTNAINILCNILQNTPTLSVIINHAGFPPYFTESNITNSTTTTANLYSTWVTNLKKLSTFTQCAIKCSGWEMTERQYTTQWCNHIIIQCIDTFGPKRVMLSSNFPLCLFRDTYQQTWQNYTTCLNHSQPSKPQFNKQNTLNMLCFENAKHWYKF